MALSATTIATSIAALSVSGLAIKDLDKIPTKAGVRAFPMVYPNPDGFMTNLVVTRQSFDTAKKDVTYTLNYVYLFKAVKSGRSLFDVYQELVTGVLAFIDAIIANDTLTGAIDITPQDVVAFGLVFDPSGEPFFGAELAFAILEFEDA